MTRDEILAQEIKNVVKSYLDNKFGFCAMAEGAKFISITSGGTIKIKITWENSAKKVNCANCEEIIEEKDAICLSATEFKLMQVAKGKTLFCITNVMEDTMQTQICKTCELAGSWPK